jgi:nucleotide-binding universal stress UspA family protein
MLQTLLFAHDFSPSSERALAYAIDLVERTDATLHLAYVEKTPESVLDEGTRSPLPSYKLEGRFRERCRTSLEKHELDPDDDRLVYHADRNEAVAPALLHVAEKEAADLIVMGTHGRRGVQRAIYGSVAEEVLRTASCPVFTARVQGEAPSESTTAPIERIAVPIDFSDLSRRALHYAARLASVYNVPLRLLHAVEEPTLPPIYEMQSPKMKSREVKERAERELRAWGEAVGDDGPEISYVVHRGEPEDTVAQAAAHVDTLTVMGTRGRSGVRRTMLGSVTEAVMREAHGPVLAARSFPDAPAE